MRDERHGHRGRDGDIGHDNAPEFRSCSSPLRLEDEPVMPARLSDAEAIMWRVGHDPMMRADVCNITLLRGQLPHEVVDERVALAAARFTRLRQRPVALPAMVGLLPLYEDRDFDLRRHVRHIHVEVDERQLIDLASDLTRPMLDESRPPWDVTVVHSTRNDLTALIQRVHHALADGIAGLRITRVLLDPSSTSTSDDRYAVQRSVSEDRRGVPLIHALGGARDAMFHLGRDLTDVRDVARKAGEIACSLGRQLVVRGGAMSPLLAGRSVDRVFRTIQIRDAHRLARAWNVGRTELLVGAIAGALGSYQAQMGSSCSDLRLALPVAMPGRQADSVDNHVIPTRTIVPTDAKDPAARMAAVSRQVKAAEAERAVRFAEPIARIANSLPGPMLRSLFRAQAFQVDFAATAIPGPGRNRTVVGLPVMAMYAIGPRYGSALNASAVTCGDRMDVGINIDPGAITDLNGFVACLEEEFDQLHAKVATPVGA